VEGHRAHLGQRYRLAPAGRERRGVPAQGDQVLVIGRLQQREYETPEHERRTAYKVEAAAVGGDWPTPRRHPQPQDQRHHHRAGTAQFLEPRNPLRLGQHRRPAGARQVPIYREHMPAPTGWRPDAPPDLVLLAIGKALGALMDKGKWTELGLLTSTRERLQAHPRLLRSLYWGDDDYQGCVYDVTPWVLDDRGSGPWHAGDLGGRFPNLGVVSDFLNIPTWLEEHEPAIHSQVYTRSEAVPDAMLPDGTVLDAAATAAARLQVAEMRRQVERIRRDYVNDPEAVVGQVKELVESACKTILGLTGTGPETEQDVPALVSAALRHLGLHPAILGDGADATEARALKRLFGGLSTVLQGAAELRNARGTGHGRSGAPVVDSALARLAAGMVLPAVIYLCEAYEQSTSMGEAPPALVSRLTATSAVSPPPPAPPGFSQGLEVAVGAIVNHSTFGRGTVRATRGAGNARRAEVAFSTGIGSKWLLLSYAPLQLVRVEA